MLRSPVSTTLLIAICLLATAARAENPVVRFSTVLGNFDVELCQEISTLCPGAAPITVANFLAYVDADRYPPTSFVHRRGTGGASPPVLQGGGYWITTTGGYRTVTAFDPIALEVGVGLSNLRGTIAMARGSAADSATSQWFVNLANNVNLDTSGGGYAVFGKVTGEAGMTIIDAIGAVPVYAFASPFGELPLINYPGSGTVVPHLVTVSSVERVPEPATALGIAVSFSALATRKCRRG